MAKTTVVYDSARSRSYDSARSSGAHGTLPSSISKPSGSSSSGRSSSSGSSRSSSSSGSSSSGSSSAWGSGYTYKVNDDGKAPLGLSVGDNVVTGGGTFRIDAVNPDGTYRSTRVSDTTTGNYTGTYRNVGGGSGLPGSVYNTASYDQPTSISQPSSISPAYSQYQSQIEEYARMQEELRRQQAARLESALGNLSTAYKNSMAGYADQESRLPQQYDTARNAAATQNALARRAFDERAAAMGLNSGTSAQAELSRSAALQSALSGIDQAQQNALADIGLQRANLQNTYQNAVAQAKSENDATLAEAMYQELLREQALAREDAQTDYARQYQLQRDAINDSLAQQQLALAQSQEDWNRAGQAFKALGDTSLYEKLGVDASKYYADALAQMGAYTPTFSQAQVLSAYNNARKAGIGLSGNMLRDYNYYMYGDPDYTSAANTGAYLTAGISSPTASNRSGAGSNRGTINGGNGGTVSTVNNGGLAPETVAAVQRAYGLTPDGSWGPASQAATGYASAAEAQRAMASRSVDIETSLSLPTAIDYNPDEGVIYWNGRGYSSKAAFDDDITNAYNRGNLTSDQLLKMLNSLNAMGVRL